MVIDADGKVYTSIVIGTQTWTVENLRTTKYNDGIPIPHVTEGTQWPSLGTPAYCFYDNSTDTAYQKKCGALYNWYAVNTGKLAPAGWHVSTDAEWKVLENQLIAKGYNWDRTTTGNKIAKSMAVQTDWTNHTKAGAIGSNLSKNNASGFSAFPGGFRDDAGGFLLQSRYSFWWSATGSGSTTARSYRLNYDAEGLYRGDFSLKCLGFAVRLLRD